MAEAARSLGSLSLLFLSAGEVGVGRLPIASNSHPQLRQSRTSPRGLVETIDWPCTYVLQVHTTFPSPGLRASVVPRSFQLETMLVFPGQTQSMSWDAGQEQLEVQRGSYLQQSRRPQTSRLSSSSNSPHSGIERALHKGRPGSVKREEVVKAGRHGFAAVKQKTDQPGIDLSLRVHRASSDVHSDMSR